MWRHVCVCLCDFCNSVDVSTVAGAFSEYWNSSSHCRNILKFSNLFLEYNSTCFGQFLCPSSVFHCTHSNGICHTACEHQAVSKPAWHIKLLCVQWKTPHDGRRNCSKHVEFYSKNKFGKLVQLVGFIIRIYQDAQPPERQTFKLL